MPSATETVPVGSIVAFIGDPTTVPDNWMVCDGGSFDPGTYGSLHTVLNSATLPNLCGYFLRGQDPKGQVDPDANRALGSVQPDDFRSHTHTCFAQTWGDQPCIAEGETFQNSSATSEATGGAETRPQNVCVLFLIYAGMPSQ